MIIINGITSLITKWYYKLTNQSARKALFTCVVYTNYCYIAFLVLINVISVHTVKVIFVSSAKQ